MNAANFTFSRRWAKIAIYALPTCLANSCHSHQTRQTYTEEHDGAWLWNCIQVIRCDLSCPNDIVTGELTRTGQGNANAG